MSPATNINNKQPLSPPPSLHFYIFSPLVVPKLSALSRIRYRSALFRLMLPASLRVSSKFLHRYASRRARAVATPIAFGLRCNGSHLTYARSRGETLQIMRIRNLVTAVRDSL